MNDQLDLRDLYYFQTIARLGHVSKAAEVLHKTQPALTGCIRRLEQSLGAKLVEKEGRNIRLTSAGELLLANGGELLHAADDLVSLVRAHEAGVTGQIKIGLVPTAAHHLLLPLTKLLTTKFPDVQLKTVIGNTDFLYDQLEKKEIDMAVGLNNDAGAGFQREPFYQDKMVVIANVNHPIFKEVSPTLDLLNHYKWVLAPRSAFSRLWIEQVFSQYALPCPIVQVETNLLMTVPGLVAHTELLSILSRNHLSVLGEVGQSLREVALPELMLDRDYLLITRKSGLHSPAAELLYTTLLDQGRQIFEERLPDF